MLSAPTAAARWPVAVEWELKFRGRMGDRRASRRQLLSWLEGGGLLSCPEPVLGRRTARGRTHARHTVALQEPRTAAPFPESVSRSLRTSPHRGGASLLGSLSRMGLEFSGTRLGCRQECAQTAAEPGRRSVGLERVPDPPQKVFYLVGI